TGRIIPPAGEGPLLGAVVNGGARIWISCSALSPGRRVMNRGVPPVSGTQKLLARIKALFGPSRPTPPAQADEVPLIPAATAVEIAETPLPEPPTLFGEPRPAEDLPAPAIETLAEATDDQPVVAVGTPGCLTLRL